MKRLTREEVQVERLLRAARSVAVLGASPHRGARSWAVAEYLKRAGFEVFPVREDRAEVAGLASWPRLADVPGRVDIVLVLTGGVDAATIEEAARKGARAIWLARGVPVGDAERLATAHGLLLVRGRDVEVEQRHTEQSAGQPRKRGVNLGGRMRIAEEPEPREPTGYVVGGGGGRKGGGGGRSVLDEKKMVTGRVSPRRPRSG